MSTRCVPHVCRDDERFSSLRQFPQLLHRMVQVVGKYIHEDFRRGTAMFKKLKNARIDVTLFCAPGLTPGKSQGKVKTGLDIPKKPPIYVTYGVLANGMIQSAHGPSLLHEGIDIVGTRMPSVEYWSMLFCFITGVICVWVPPLWRIGYRRGWWVGSLTTSQFPAHTKTRCRGRIKLGIDEKGLDAAAWWCRITDWSFVSDGSYYLPSPELEFPPILVRSPLPS